MNFWSKILSAEVKALGFETPENRDMTPKDVRTDVKPEYVGNLVRQDRAEESSKQFSCEF